MTQNDKHSPWRLVHQLCCRYTRAEDDSVTATFQRALKILASRSYAPYTTDDLEVSDRIKTRLVKQECTNDAVKFSELYRKLQTQGVLMQKWSILYFLDILSQANNKGQNKASGLQAILPFYSSSTPVTVPSGGGRPPSGFTSSGISTLSTIGSRSSAATQHHAISTPALTGLGSRAVESVTSVASRRVGAGTFLADSHGKVALSTDRRSKRTESHAGCTSQQKQDSDYTDGEPSEEELLREVMFALQGVEGRYITHCHSTDAFHVTDKVSAPLAAEVEKIAECGWLHNRVRRFIGNRNSDLALGLVGQSFCAALQEHLQQYYKLIAILHAQFHQEEGVSNREPGLTLKRVMLWTVEPKEKLKTLAALVDACRGKKGGALASILHYHTFHGDPQLRSLSRHTLHMVSRPIYEMLLKWIYDGELLDQYHEFFVASDPAVKEDRLWHEKYSVRKSMVPSFITMDQARRILLTGKSINFLHQVCCDRSLVRGLTKQAMADGFDIDMEGRLQTMIDTVYTDTSRHLLAILNSRYKFFEHVRALRRYLLLGQGDFILCLMDLLESDLAKPAHTLYLHNLTGTLESAIRATNAQFDDSNVLKRLDVRLLEFSAGDCGWDVFTLDYHVDGPISTVFTPESILMYLRVFNLLWRAKRMEYILTASWKMQTAESRVLYRSVPELWPVLHQCSLLGSEMMHFTQQMQYYITFEVMACSWDELSKQIHEARDLDCVISAHQQFLETIIRQSLLSQDAKPILTKLRTIFDLTIQFQQLSQSIFSRATKEHDTRAQHARLPSARGEKGTWGVTEQEAKTEEKRREDFTKIYIPMVRGKLRILAQSYQDMTQQFLLMVTEHGNISLRCLSFRLDFNEYYNSRDSRLRTSLSFHRKMSSLSLNAGKQSPL